MASGEQDDLTRLTSQPTEWFNTFTVSSLLYMAPMRLGESPPTLRCLH